ncbi:MAG: NfeD family protein [Actinomycetota bacterium]|nr:NfeD family protein [Actinomycetota bacterium]
MLFIIGVTLAIIFLDWPWRLLVIIPLALVEILEIGLWLKLRRVRSITGAEAMVGAKGVALTNCEPDGQVRLKGQTWQAHSRRGVEAGEAVVVTGMNGIRLEVDPAPPPEQTDGAA